MSRPLDGIGLLQLCNPDAPVAVRLASSLAGKIAADLGARVVKVEPVGGDPVRGLPPILPDGRSALYQFLNTSKQVLRAPAAAIATLLQGDIRLVLGEEDDPALAAAAGQRLGVVEVAGWPVGLSGPLSEFTVLALGGLLDMIGDPKREPLRLGGHPAAYAAGLAAFTALMAQAAALERGLPTKPARVSLVETMVWVNWKAVCGAAADGTPPTRQGERAECQVVPCRDGWIAVVYTGTQFGALRELTDDPRLGDPRFATRAGRMENGARLYAILRPWFAERDREAIYAAAQACGVPLGPVYGPADLLDDPQYVARGFIASLGGLRLPQLPVRWNGGYFAPGRA
jgi:crotonobetainyl-CoA:carnitine CoA-transferase CaiB-like acyl-CoA transferase